MGKSKTILHSELRATHLARVMAVLSEMGEDVHQVGSNELAFPVVDSEGNDEWVVVTLKVPTGSRDGEPYDGYHLADCYKADVAEKAEKAKAKAEEKANKIARDTAMRKAKADAKAKHDAEMATT